MSTRQSALSQLIHETLDPEVSWPHPDGVEMIYSLGAEAVPPLRELLRSFLLEPDSSPHADIIVGLLGDLRAADAAEELIEVLAKTDEFILELVVTSLRLLPRLPLEAIFEVFQRSDLTWYQRAMAMDVLEYAAFDDPTLRDRLERELGDALTALVDRHRTLSADDSSLAGSLVSALADMHSVKYRPVIERAFQLEVIDLSQINEEDVRRAYTEPKRRRETPTEPYYRSYRHRYAREAHVSHPQKEDDESPAMGAAKPQVSQGLSEYTRPEPVRIVKIGRNDPCPCGSGKKFKKCCAGKAE